MNLDKMTVYIYGCEGTGRGFVYITIPWHPIWSSLSIYIYLFVLFTSESHVIHSCLDGVSVSPSWLCRCVCM